MATSEDLSNRWSNLKRLDVSCLDVIASNFDLLLHAFELGNILPRRYYEFLQRSSSNELLERLRHRNDLSIQHVEFFFNPYIRTLDLDPFDVRCFPEVLKRLSFMGKKIKSFRVTKRIYSKRTLFQIIYFLRNVESLCLQTTRCSDRLLKSIARYLPFVKAIDVKECMISDRGIRALCRQGEGDVILENPMLEVLDVHFTNVTLNGVIFAMRYFPNLTKLGHDLLYRAIYETHSLSDLSSLKERLPTMRTYNFKELEINRYGRFNAEIGNTLSILCPHLTSLQVFDIETQAEINACSKFTELTEVSFSIKGNEEECHMTNFIMLRGENLIKLEIAGGNLSLLSVVKYCPNLQFLRLEQCEFESDDSCSSSSVTDTLKDLKTFALSDIFLPLLNYSVKVFLLSCPNLEQLMIFHGDSITDSFVQHLLKCDFISSLREFSAFYSRIEISAIKLLIEGAPNMKKILVYGCYCSKTQLEKLMQIGEQNKKVRLVIEKSIGCDNFDSYQKWIRAGIWKLSE